LNRSISRPAVVEQAALLLLRQGRKPDALRLVTEAVGNSPDDAGLLLANALVLAVSGQNAAAEKRLRQLQSRWPEWERPYLVHGLLFEELGRVAEARQKLRTAMALGAGGPNARCALARLNGAPSGDPECRCRKGLEGLLQPSCDAQ
jgi:Flp pilus assembly protein TadD